MHACPCYLQLAERMLLAAHRLCPMDPTVSHELGVVAYKNGLWVPGYDQGADEIRGWGRLTFEGWQCRQECACTVQASVKAKGLQVQGVAVSHELAVMACMQERAVSVGPQCTGSMTEATSLK